MKRFLILLLSLSALTTSCKDQKNPSDKEVDTSEETNSIKAVESSVKVHPISHATSVLEWNGKVLYIDPVGGSDTFKNYPDPDIILITDIHGDHFSPETLNALNTEKAKVVVPQAVADGLPESFGPELHILNNGKHYNIEGFDIEAIPMYNLRDEAKDFHVKGRGNGYVIDDGSTRIYFSGDTEDIPEMRALKDIDKAFVCMNLPYTMTVSSAADAVLDFKPKEVYPYHYRGNPEVSDVSEFKSLVLAGDPTIEVVQLDWYPDEAY